MDESPTISTQAQATLRVALVGNPNTGKTTLFNALCGLRHKTGNFPGTTQEARVGRVKIAVPLAGAIDVELIDLPGIYSLELAQSESEIARRVLAGSLAAPGMVQAAPDAVCVVVDALNLERNLTLVGEVLRRRLPTLIALNMIDLARKRGVAVDADALAAEIGCPVVAVSGRTGEGLQALCAAKSQVPLSNRAPSGTREGVEQWASNAFTRAMAATRAKSPHRAPADLAQASARTDRIDRVLTHPVLGLAIFAAIMFGLFYAIFSIAQVPMGLIEAVFGGVQSWLTAKLPQGILSDFITGGVVAGLGSTLVFLPQICLLFFLISLLEDTGYLARAAFLIDRFMRPFGLSGYAFVPLLSSHACALPGIMATRAIPDAKERLAAILVAPFMSCSARIPVYVLLTTLLFPLQPGMQALAFIGCYALGAAAGMGSALLARRTLLKGKSRAMALELPTYKLPSLRTAIVTTFDRGLVFVKKAGTMILAICIVLWWLSSYPKLTTEPAPVTQLREQATQLRAASSETAQQANIIDPSTDQPIDVAALTLAQREEVAASIEALANERHNTASTEFSVLGRTGKAVQPVFAPLGYDWQLSIGVLASFAAREVFASTMAVITTGSDDAESEGAMQRIRTATRSDGTTLIFTPAVSWSLLVYFVLAMQCLPTLAVTAKEAGGMKWALLQLGWMSLVAYVAALIVYQSLR
jgi:ferrous iron transport protein B